MRKLYRRLYALVHRRRLERELADEMAAHREMMPAERQSNFGSDLRLREQAGDHWGWNWIDQLWRDLAYGLRSLRRSPGFTLTAVAILSLGIGVNLAEAHLFNALLHRLQVRDIDSLYRFYSVSKAGYNGMLSFPAVDFYRRNNRAMSAVIAQADIPGVFDEQSSESLRCILTTSNMFGDLGVLPAYGRVLTPQDDLPGAPPVAVLGYDYWQNRFGGDPGVVTKTIRLNDKPVQVVGVASPEFEGIVRIPTGVWMPLSQVTYLTGDSRMLTDSGARPAIVIGRLKPGVSVEAAQEEFRSLTAQLRSQQPAHVEAGEWVKLESMDGPPRATVQGVLLVVTCVLMVLLVLFSACANLGNMLMARGLARDREIAIRLAVGAERWRLIRQLMTENFLLAMLASAAALLVGKLAASVLLRMIDAPSNVRIVTDWRIVAVCVFLGLLSTLTFGLAPAFQAVRRGIAATRARKTLVSIQVAASCVLLILSSFLTRAAEHSLRADVTFDFAGMTEIDPALYTRSGAPGQARQTLLQLVDCVRGVPGVDGVSLATVSPVKRSWIEHAGKQQLYLNAVDPSYFAVMRVPLLAGRMFGAADADPAIVSESAARALWPRESPLGQTILIARRERTVLGVVKDSGMNRMTNPDSVEAYTPIDDAHVSTALLLVHTVNTSGKLSGTLRAAATLPGLTPWVGTFQSIVESQLDTVRKMATVVASLGAVASLLALLGIFGLLAFTVAQRTREIGVRMALGARRSDVLRCVLQQYSVPFFTGAGLGILIAAAGAKFAGSVVFGFIPFDLASFVAGLLLFALVALAASIAPVRRAMRIDPAAALRHE